MIFSVAPDVAGHADNDPHQAAKPLGTAGLGWRRGTVSSILCSSNQSMTMGLFLLSPSTVETRLEQLIKLCQPCRDPDRETHHGWELSVVAARWGYPQVQAHLQRSLKGVSFPYSWSLTLLKGPAYCPPGESSAQSPGPAAMNPRVPAMSHWSPP